MWKSGKKQGRTRLFSPQPIVENFRVFHRAFFAEFPVTVLHRFFLHIPQGVWRKMQNEKCRMKNCVGCFAVS